MQDKYKISKHLEEKWIYQTITNFDKNVKIEDNEYHYFKKIPEFSNKCLKVVLNPVYRIQ